MRIVVNASPAVREVLRDELWKELQVGLPVGEFCLEAAAESSEKGLWEDIVISVLSSVAAEIVGKIISSFTKKYKVEITILEADGRKIDVSYKGDSCEELEKFLLTYIQ